MTVTSISTQPGYLWLSYFYLLDNLGGNYSWVRRNTLILGEIFPGDTRTGFVLFPVLDANAYSIMLVVTEVKGPENIVYQFTVNL